MSNVCIVSYICEAEKTQLAELDEALETLKNKPMPLVDNDWGNMWLGCVIKQLGGDWHNHQCRGSVLDFGINGNGTFSIEQQTAWQEQCEFRRFLEQRFPGLKVYFREVEPALGNIGTNDGEGKYFPERYFLETSECLHYYQSIEEAADAVSTILGYKVLPDFDDISDALSDFADECGGEESFVHFLQITIEE